jgi:hypothetical protein
MKIFRSVLLCLSLIGANFVFGGCQKGVASGEDEDHAIDAPLMTNAPAPPPRPKKLSPSVSGS